MHYIGNAMYYILNIMAGVYIIINLCL